MSDTAEDSASFQSCESFLCGEVTNGEPQDLPGNSIQDLKCGSTKTSLGSHNVPSSYCKRRNNIESRQVSEQEEEAILQEQESDTEIVKEADELVPGVHVHQLTETKQYLGSEKGNSKSACENVTKSSSAERTENSEDTQPIKPPRRKHNSVASTEIMGSREKLQISTDICEDTCSKQDDPSPIRKRQLPATPNSCEKHPKELNSDVFSIHTKGIKIVSVEHIDDKLQDVCKPIMTSSPVNSSAVSHTPNSSRIISFISPNSPDEVKKVKTFYDYLQNQSQDGSSSEQGDNIYDSVSQETQKDKTVNRYDEVEGVIINQEAYIMPAAEESDDWSDEDPWGSDFETDDDDGTSRVAEEDPYDSVEVMPISQRRRPFHFAAESAGKTPEVRRPNLQRLRDAISGSMPGFKSLPGSIQGIPGTLQSCLTAGIRKTDSLPYLASKRKVAENLDEEDGLYVDPNIADTQQYHQPVMPPMQQGLTKQQAKRYQITKFFLESESDYMQLLDTLIKRYELPIRDRDLLEPSKIDVIFEHVHRVLDCHVMFSIALSDRMAQWDPDKKIGDILYALFQKSMVLEAYSGYVNNFTRAMDTVRTACRTHLAFSQFLKIRRQSCRECFSLHYLMLKPIKRFPQLVALVQELLLVTPKEHPDRVPLQLALTKLECLAESLNDRKREAELRNKVKLLDSSTAQLSKPLSTGTRYFIRQDDLVQCVVEGHSIVKTKKRRLVMLSDMLVCLSWVKGKKDRMTHLIADPRMKYKLKWNVPLTDVEIVEYGPGVNVTGSAHRTTITYTKEGQYRKGYSGCTEHFEDLQHDLAVVGQIAGLVATLRRSYEVLDNERVQQWHRAVQRTIEEETRLANIYWLELSLPSKNGRVHYIFSADSPTTKAEWVTDLNTAKLRLAPTNNPGWYLPEDDGTGAVAVQRRNMPLLKDKSDLFLLNPKARIESIVSCPDISDLLPGIHDNYNLLWLLCSCGDHVGQVSVVKISSTSIPQVVESFHVADSRILCGEFVGQTCGEKAKVKAPFTGRFGFPFPTVWLGTQQGRIYIYNTIDPDRRYVMSVKLPDTVLLIRAVEMKIFAGLANGNVVVFKQNKDFMWNFQQPDAVSLSEQPVTCVTKVAEALWFGSANKIFAFNYQKEVVDHVIEIDSDPKVSVRSLVSYGVGVWVSINKQPTVKLYHSETLEHVQDISVALPISKMQNDVDSQIEKTKLDKLYITTMTAVEGLLWVGTSVGIILVFSLPRLEGIPLASGQPCVSFHAYRGRVRSLFPLKDNPENGLKFIEAQSKKPTFKLFRDFETRDACVQTDACISGAGTYAANGPSAASRFKGKFGPGSVKSDVMYAEEDEDLIDSDEEFFFIEDQQGLERVQSKPVAREPRIPPIAEEKPSEQSTEEKTKDVPEASLINVEGKIKVDEFARLMSEFQGFSTSVSKPEQLKPQPEVVGIKSEVFTDVEAAEKLQESTPNEAVSRRGIISSEQEKKLQGVSGHVEIKGSEEASSTAVKQEDNFPAGVKCTDEFIKLADAQVISEKAVMKPKSGAVGKDTSAAAIPQYDEPEEGIAVAAETSQELGFSSPEYLVVTHCGDVPQESFTKSGSFSIFDETRSEGLATSPSNKGDVPVKKLRSLKPKLPFPLLLVSAGEGHVDMRTTRKGENGLEPRLLVWQMN